jgi:cytochrome c556
MRSKRAAALAALVLSFSVGTMWADDKIPSIEDIMGNQHSKDGTLDKITAAVKKDDPEWGKIQDLSKEYAKEISLLGKNKMPDGKGTAAQWKDWTKQIADSAKNLDEQAKKKDKEGLTKAIAKIKPDQCMRCHDKFRD